MKTITPHSPRKIPCSLTQAAWNPYLVGTGIGILSWLVFFFVDKPLGMSTEVSKLSGWVIKAFGGRDFVDQNAYWAKNVPKFGYSTVFLLFTALGTFISSRASNTFQKKLVPTVLGRALWRTSLETNPGCLWRWRTHSLRRSNGWRMYQWSRHQRDSSTGGIGLAFLRRDVRRRSSHSSSHVQKLTFTDQ